MSHLTLRSLWCIVSSPATSYGADIFVLRSKRGFATSAFHKISSLNQTPCQWFEAFRFSPYTSYCRCVFDCAPIVFRLFSSLPQQMLQLLCSNNDGILSLLCSLFCFFLFCSWSIWCHLRVGSHKFTARCAPPEFSVVHSHCNPKTLPRQMVMCPAFLSPKKRRNLDLPTAGLGPSRICPGATTTVARGP